MDDRISSALDSQTELRRAMDDLRASVRELEAELAHDWPSRDPSRPARARLQVIEGGGQRSAGSPRPLLAVLTPD